MSVVRAPSAALLVLDKFHPPSNVRAVSEQLCLALDGQGLAYLMLEHANLVAENAVADQDAVHADFRGAASPTSGEVFDTVDDPDISFGTSAPTSVKAFKMPDVLGGGARQLFLDHRMQGDHVEHPSCRSARITMFAWMTAAFINQQWILADIVKGNFFDVLVALHRLDASTPLDEQTDALMQAAEFAREPSGLVDFPKLTLHFQKFQQVFARQREAELRVGAQVLVPLFLKALSKDKSLATSLALFYQIKPMPSFSETLAYWSEITSRIGKRSPGILTFPAMVEGPPAQSMFGQPPRGQRGAQGVVRVCYAEQRGKGKCTRGDACNFSHDPKDLENAPPPPPMRDPKSKRGVCAACGSSEHGVEKCPRRREQAPPAGYIGQPAPLDPLTTLSQAEVDQLRRYLAGTTVAHVPSVGGSMAVLGVDQPLQDMLNHARDR